MDISHISYVDAAPAWFNGALQVALQPILHEVQGLRNGVQDLCNDVQGLRKGVQGLRNE